MESYWTTMHNEAAERGALPQLMRLTEYELGRCPPRIPGEGLVPYARRLARLLRAAVEAAAEYEDRQIAALVAANVEALS